MEELQTLAGINDYEKVQQKYFELMAHAVEADLINKTNDTNVGLFLGQAQRIYTESLVWALQSIKSRKEVIGGKLSGGGIRLSKS